MGLSHCMYAKRYHIDIRLTGYDLSLRTMQSSAQLGQDVYTMWAEQYSQDLRRPGQFRAIPPAYLGRGT